MCGIGGVLIWLGILSLSSCNVLPNDTDLNLTTASAPPTNKTFKGEEKEIFDFVNSILRQLLPRIIRGSSTSLPLRCTGAMMKIFGGIRKLKGWTLQMLDSMGKPTSGILQGTAYSAANYDQCLGISASHRGEVAKNLEEELFHGRYCRIRLEMAEVVLNKARDYKQGRINSSELGRLKEMIEEMPYIPFMKHPMTHIMGICVPSLCYTEDITTLLGSLPFPGSVKVEQCEDKEELIVDFETRIVLGIFFFIILLVAIGTAVDRLIRFLAEDNLNMFLKKRCISLAIAFSIRSNTKRLFQRIENDDTEFPNWRVLRGLVVATIFGLILHNTYLPPYDAFYVQASNLANLETYLNARYFAITVCLPIVVETLFLSYGFLLTNKAWKTTWKNGKTKINVFETIASSYLKLCLPLLFCNGIILLLPLIGSGPFWNDVFASPYDNCRKFWWLHIGMIGNFYDKKEQCFPHFWFVPCLMQIILIATVMMKILSRCRRVGLFLIVCLVLGSHITVAIETFNKDYPPTYIAYFSPRSGDEFWRTNYASPLNHASSFAIGMLLGIYLAKGTKITIKPIVWILSWIFNIGCIICICTLMYSYRREVAPMSPVGSALFAATHRTLFALAVASMFWICALNYESFVGKILSWSVLDPLYKMSYFAYLLHPVIIAFHIGTSRQHFEYSHLELIMRCLSYVCLTYAASYVCCLLVDLPIKSIRSALFPSHVRQVKITSLNNERLSVDYPQPIRHNGVENFTVWTTENPQNGSKH